VALTLAQLVLVGVGLCFGNVVVRWRILVGVLVRVVPRFRIATLGVNTAIQVEIVVG